MAGVRLGKDVAGGQVEQDLGEEPEVQPENVVPRCSTTVPMPLRWVTAAGPRRLDTLTGDMIFDTGPGKLSVRLASGNDQD